ncbi:pseudouridine synthase [Maritalea porphyrae]|uniref:pseudouridine synthase n=1 Tax=Maritalea porphyrae TaxID=880732 RepID=UPI0022B07B76|nr:pseudouridine synthase [Maritalea porphyrae]MCZ4271434.1 pseudouridine synthase [Maritalea porphyrae]
MATDKKGAPQKTREGERIAKVIARSGHCSRRMAETWIEEGRIAINGKVISTPAYNVTDKDKITVDGNRLAQKEATRMWLYYKPAGLVVSESDPDGRPTVFDDFEKAGLPRVLTVGRLDINTEGLLMLTNEGGLKRVLELPSTGWTRRYRVRAHGRITQEKLDELKDGITVDKVHYGPIEASLERQQGANAWIVISLKEGKNREVKNVLAALGLDVNRLIRISYGPFQLNEMKVGEILAVKSRVLKDQLSAKLAQEAGVDFDGPIVPVEIKKPTRNQFQSRGKPQEPVKPAGKPVGRVDRPVRPVRKKFEERPTEDFTPKSKVFFDDGRTEIIDTPEKRSKDDDDRKGGKRRDDDRRGGDRKGFGDKRPYGDKRAGSGGPGRREPSRGQSDARNKPADRDRKPSGDKKPYGDKKSFGDRDRRPSGENKSFEERGGRPQSAKTRGPRRDDRTANDRRGAFVQRDERPSGDGDRGRNSARPESRGRGGKNKTFVSAKPDDSRGYGKPRSGGRPTGGKPGGKSGGKPTGRPAGKPAGSRSSNPNANPNRRASPPKSRK